MSKITIIEGNSNDKDQIRNYMVKGERGDDGVSPTFETSKTGNVATITITDVEGTHTVELEDGVDLTGGVPTNGIIPFDGTTIPNGYEEANIVDIIYPIGSIYMSVNNTNPSTLFGGTWTNWGAGKVPVGVDTSDTNFNTVEKTGGEATHTLTIDEMPSHSHAPLNSDAFLNFVTNDLFNYQTGSASGSKVNNTRTTTAETGGGLAHNNLQPYITCYMWKRIA